MGTLEAVQGVRTSCVQGPDPEYGQDSRHVERGNLNTMHGTAQLSQAANDGHTQESGRSPNGSVAICWRPSARLSPFVVKEQGPHVSDASSRHVESPWGRKPYEGSSMLTDTRQPHGGSPPSRQP